MSSIEIEYSDATHIAIALGLPGRWRFRSIGESQRPGDWHDFASDAFPVRGERRVALHPDGSTSTWECVGDEQYTIRDYLEEWDVITPWPESR